jgi:hypothetical protein
MNYTALRPRRRRSSQFVKSPHIAGIVENKFYAVVGTANATSYGDYLIMRVKIGNATVAKFA